MKDLTELRKVIEAGITPGPWEMVVKCDEEDLPETVAVGSGEYLASGGANYRVNDLILEVDTSSYEEGHELDEVLRRAKFIATFDPPTVLELLDRAERAEAKLITQTRVLKTIAKRNVSLASDRAKMVWNLEQAEATIQRVREVATEMAGHTMPEGPKGSAWILAEGAQLFAKDVLEALDTTP